VRAAAALLGALALAGCGGSAADPPAPPGSPAQRATPTPAPPSDADRLRTLLLERAAALEAGDASAYGATATGPQRARDRAAARRAARLRLADVDLEADDIAVDGRRATLRVDAAYRIRGVRGEFGGTRRVVAVRSNGRWRVRAVRGTRGLAPWEVDAFAEHRTEHFVVLAPPSVPVAELLPELEAGYARMGELLSRRVLRRRYLVVVAGDAVQARALTTQIRGVATLAAIADATVREEGSARRVTSVGSLRLFVVWPRFAALDAEGRQRVVTHELTHAALAGSTSGRTPGWLTEGVALYVSGDRRTLLAPVDLGALSRPGAITRLSGAAQAGAYAASSAAAFAIADRFGRRRLLALYDAFNDERLAGDPGPRLANRALRRELGISLRDLEAMLGD
jgi:hypothetical protein